MWSFFSRNKKKPQLQNNHVTQSTETQIKQPLSKSLAKNQKLFKDLFNNCNDVVYRKFSIGEERTPALLIFIHGLVDAKMVNKNIMKSLMEIQYSTFSISNADSFIELIEEAFLETGNTEEIFTPGKIIDAVLTGDTVLLLDGTAKALSIGTKGWDDRAVAEPVTEGVVRGPRDGFTETLRTNTALLRRRIKTHQFKLEKYVLGRATKTEINLAYLEGVVDQKVVEEVRKRIERIDVDSILESAYVEEFIEDTPYTVFPQIEHSERPDKVAAAILEGRVAIITDGTPFVLLVPTILFQFYQSSEDYYERYPFAFMVRMVRYIFSTFALLLPASYIAVTTYHQEMLPTALMISITSAHEGVPFPAFVEALMMEVTLEALREAGIRLPRPVGQAVSIVGALVVGQAAVEAGLVSPAMVIVVALTAISSFAIPAYNLALAIRFLRFFMMILGATLGFYGIMLGLVGLLIHLTSLRSFGVPYLSPIAPVKLNDLKDVLIRAPWWAMGERPSFIGKNNRRRQKSFLKPHLPDNDNNP